MLSRQKSAASPSRLGQVANNGSNNVIDQDICRQRTPRAAFVDHLIGMRGSSLPRIGAAESRIR
jgi:hypothetical protein